MSKRPKAQYFRPLSLLWAAVAYYLLLVPAAFADELSSEERGRHALETRCSRCHAIGLDDDSSHPEAPPFRAVMRRYPPEELEEALAEGITSGHPDMPEFILSPGEIADVVSYLHTLSGP